MKLVNPIGKKPVEKSDLKAYACKCTTVGTVNAPSDSVSGYGHMGCSHCGCSCGIVQGDSNYSSNSGEAYSSLD